MCIAGDEGGDASNLHSYIFELQVWKHAPSSSEQMPRTCFTNTRWVECGVQSVVCSSECGEGVGGVHTQSGERLLRSVARGGRPAPSPNS